MKNASIKAWAALDRLLLAAVFAMLGLALWKGLARDEAAAPEAASAEAEPERAAPRSEPAVEALRVGGRKLPQIARLFAAAPWEAEAAAPALDMREDEKGWEIAFSVPEGADPAAAKVTAAGHVLSFSMVLPGGRGFIQRQVRIPCEIASEAQVRTAFTNGVLRVRVTPR